MRTLYFLILFYLNAWTAPEVWVNQGSESTEFSTAVYENNGISITEFYLAQFEKRAADQNYLLSKTDFWSRNQISSTVLDNEVQELQKNYIFNSSNRLLLFEFFKQNATGAKSLCHLYGNDNYLKTSEPFFESNCGLYRISLAEINSDFLKFDFLLVDGNKIDISESPYFFSSGEPHQFIFISNRYITKEITATVKSLKKTPVSLEPWVEGTCDKITKNNTSLSDPVKIYFSKDCIQNANASESATLAFIQRNKYYIISGLLITLLAAYASSQYELGVTLP